MAAVGRTLRDARVGAKVAAVRRLAGGGVEVTVDDGGLRKRSETFDAVVVATVRTPKLEMSTRPRHQKSKHPPGPATKSLKPGPALPPNV